MDLAIYISELLDERGEVNIPGVGYFAQSRVNGYYNEQESTFYPPGNKVIFGPEVSNEDDALAEYIAVKRNISLVSAKYFVDKYLVNLRQEIQIKQVEIADIGYLSTENSTILFKAGKGSNDSVPGFYGLQPIKASKTGHQYLRNEAPVIESAPQIIIPEERTYIPPVIPEEDAVSKAQVFSPHDTEEELQFIEEEIRRPNLPVIIIFSITIVALILFGIYLYKPSLFGSKDDTTTIVKPVDEPKLKPAAADTGPKADTQKGAAIIPKPVAAVIDTPAVKHYELLGGAFKTSEQINVAIKNYQSLGLKPRILKRAPGKLYKITLGTYFSPAEAIRVQDSISKATRIRKSSIIIQPINPKR